MWRWIWSFNAESLQILYILVAGRSGSAPPARLCGRRITCNRHVSTCHESAQVSATPPTDARMDRFTFWRHGRFTFSSCPCEGLHVPHTMHPEQILSFIIACHKGLNVPMVEESLLYDHDQASQVLVAGTVSPRRWVICAASP